MKVQDLKKRAIVVSDFEGATGSIVLATEAGSEWVPVIVDFLGEELQSTEDDGVWHDTFDNKQEALKAAALFRASYEMQQAIKLFVDDESDESESDRYARLYAALELSENTNQSL